MKQQLKYDKNYKTKSPNSNNNVQTITKIKSIIPYITYKGEKRKENAKNQKVYLITRKQN